MANFSNDVLIGNFDIIKDNIASKIINVSKTLFLRQYKRQEDPDGKPWQELKESTLKYKKSGNKILQENGYLIGALSNSVLNGSSKWNDCRLVITGVPYASAHQYGEGHMPERRILGHNQTLQDAQLSIIIEEITKLFTK